MEVLMGWPLNKDGQKTDHVITAGYSYKDGSAHNAIDMSTGRKDGLPVYAALSGTVNFTYMWNGEITSGDTNSYGNVLKLKHDDYDARTLETLYAHLSKIVVSKGQRVNKGDLIGYSGHTGYVVPAGINGAHLHFEVRLGGSKVGINPLCWLDNKFVPADPFVKLFKSGQHSVEVAGGTETPPIVNVPNGFTGECDTNAVSLSATQNGIDVSRYQGKIDWNAVKASGVKFALLRAGYGQYINQKDPYFEINYAGAKAAGLPVGAYWYSYAKTAQAGIAEADICNQAIRGKQFELPIYFDQEDKTVAGQSKSVKTSIATAFCAAMTKYGWFTGYYCYTDWATGVDYAGISKMYTCWLADYRAGYDKTLPRDIHQYTSSGIVTGISGKVDMNTMTRNFETEIKRSKLNGWGVSNAPTDTTPPIVPEDKPTMTNVAGKLLKVKSANCEYFATYSTDKPIGKLANGGSYPVIAVEKSAEYVNGFSWVTFSMNGVTYWCAMVEDNRAIVENAPKADAPVAAGGFSKGRKVRLSGKLFVNATTATGSIRSGIWYIYDGVKYGNRYRVTNLVSRVGKLPLASNVSGYVNASDIKVV